MTPSEQKKRCAMPFLFHDDAESKYDDYRRCHTRSAGAALLGHPVSPITMSFLEARKNGF